MVSNFRKPYFQDVEMADFENEFWKDVIAYEGLYKVSNFGRIKSLITNKILKQYSGGNKQMQVTLCADGVKNKIYVSNIVGGTFLRFTVKGEVYLHNDSDPTNNSVDNISIGIRSHSSLLAYHNGVRKDWGIKTVGAKTKFVPKQLYIGTNADGIETKYTFEELNTKYGTGVRSILRCIAKQKNFNTAYKQTWKTEPIEKE